MNKLMERFISLVLICTIMAPVQAGTQMYFIHNDHLGTPQVVTDQSQTVVWEGKQKPFGEVEETTASIEQLSRFPGQYFDEESGLHYNYFRDYDPSTGRYLQSDPIGLRGGINTYAYVGGNPLMYTDPRGEAGVLIIPATAGVGVLYCLIDPATCERIRDICEDIIDEYNNPSPYFDEASDDRVPTPETHPEDFDKLRGDQGHRPKDKKKKNERWKKDKLHGDHWDVSDSRSGDKTKEVDYDGNQLWPGGPKNKNKR